VLIRYSRRPNAVVPSIRVGKRIFIAERLEVDDSVAAAMAEEKYIDPEPIPDRYLVDYNE
jgi:hypothetical protein